MATQINQNEKVSSTMAGHLVWWTVQQAEREASEVVAAGLAAGVPQWILDRVSGRTPRGAWQAATQLGAKGKPSALLSNEAPQLRARYMTRDVQGNLRGFIREVIDPNNVAIQTVLVATCELNESKGTLSFTILNDASEMGLFNEVERLCSGMRKSFDDILDKVDESKIASLVRDWLERKHRVCVRGTGGVYLVPQPRFEDEQEQVLGELMSICKWLNSPALGSLFSVVEVHKGGSTTLETFVASAIEELRAEIEDVNGKLDGWRKNDKMNDGSVMFSAGTMQVRLRAIREKIATLTASLGEEVEVVNLMADTVQKKADEMQSGAALSVQNAKAQRDAAKPVKAPKVPKPPKATKKSKSQQDDEQAQLAAAELEADAAIAEGSEIEVIEEDDQDAQEAYDAYMNQEYVEEGDDITREPVEDDIPSITLESLSDVPAKKPRKPRSDKGTKKSGISK